MRFSRTQGTTSALLSAAREDASLLLLPEDPKREPTVFNLALTADMGAKRGTGNGSFVAETQIQVLSFYGDVVQQIQKWAPKTPRLSEAGDHKDSQTDSPSSQADSTGSSQESTSTTSDEVPATGIASYFRPGSTEFESDGLADDTSHQGIFGSSE